MARQRGAGWQSDVIKPDGSRERKQHKTLESANAYERSHEARVDGDVVPQELESFVLKFFSTLWSDVKHPIIMNININTCYEYFGKDKLLIEISTAEVILYQTWMRDTKCLSNTTINKKSSALRMILDLAEKLDLLIKLPHIPNFKNNKGRERILTVEEELKLFQTTTEHGLINEAAIIQFLLYTGCRLGELYSLQRTDCTKRTALFRDTKNGTNRMVALSQKAASALEHLLEVSEYELPARAVHRSTMRDRWNFIRKELGFLKDPEFVPHMLRHTCCTRLVSAGITITTVKEWML